MGPDRFFARAHCRGKLLQGSTLHEGGSLGASSCMQMRGTSREMGYAI
jgi:hypothetical protein